MTNETETIGLTMSRQIPATPDEVFDAYTDAEKQTIWFNLLSEHPGIVEIEVDLRVGGTQTAVWGPSRDELFTEVQTFLEIDRPHRLVTKSTGNDPSGQAMTTEIVVTFEANDEGTLMTVVQNGFPNVEMRDFFSTYVMVGAFDRIVAFFDQGYGS